MKDWTEILLHPSNSIHAAIQKIENGSAQIALVVSDEHKLLGTVTDGDIRRGILKGANITDKVALIMNRQPKVATTSDNREVLMSMMKQMQLRQIPIVNRLGQVVGLETLDELLLQTRRENIVVLMAGGLGTRLRPLTETCPKPMLDIGGRPILETILMNFIEHGFCNFYLSVNYMASVLKDYFGDGSNWNVNIQYIQETLRLGTAGALSLLPEKPQQPVIVMNGDLLTKVNFSNLLDFHNAQQATATMCVREYDFQVPYGVVKLANHRILDLEEKPVQRFFVNAGIYVLDPSLIQEIPVGKFFDMPSLFKMLGGKGRQGVAFPIHEYWLDIGKPDDLQRGVDEFKNVFK